MAKAAKPGKTAAPRRGARKSFAIDLHAHVIQPEIMQFAKGNVVQHGPPKGFRLSDAQKKKMARARQRMERRFMDVKTRIREMDKAGVDIQVLTGSLVHQCTYWAKPADSLRMERLGNEAIAQTVAAKPDRFRGLGGVPLHNTPRAVTELERCMGQLGLSGVQISSLAGSKDLGDPSLDPFWQKAEELGALIVIHPAGIADARFQKYALWNSVGQPLEEAMAMSSLFYEGVMDRFPKLNFLIGHGGGYLPYYAGRSDRNYIEKPATRVNMSKSPSAYMRQFYYDSCVYNRDILEFLVKKVGAGRILMGSDYPVGEEDPIGFVRNSRAISAADKEKILWKNAARLLGIRL